MSVFILGNLRFLYWFRNALAHPEAQRADSEEPDNERRNAHRAEKGNDDKSDAESEHH